MHLVSSVRIVLVVGGLLLAGVPLAGQWEDGPGEVPYVPTPPQVVEAMLKLGGVGPGDTVIDLGCGDGRIAVMAAKEFKARAMGYDINPERIREAEENAKQAGVTDRVKFIEKDLFQADIHEATVVTLYLLPSVNLRLRPKLWKDLKVGTRIVSHAFDMGDWEPEKKEDADGRTIYLWRIQEKHKQMAAAAGVDGEWAFHATASSREVDARLTLKSESSRLTGTLAVSGERSVPIQEGTIEGNAVSFVVRWESASGNVTIYKAKGTMDGNQISGSIYMGADSTNPVAQWTAKRN